MLSEEPVETAVPPETSTHVQVYGPVPFEGVAVKPPVEVPLQPTLVLSVKATVIPVGSITVALSTAGHKLLSSTVTVYVPAPKLMAILSEEPVKTPASHE